MSVLSWTPMQSNPDVSDAYAGTFRLQLSPVDGPSGDAWFAALFDEREQLPDMTWRFRAPSRAEAESTAETGALNHLAAHASRIQEALAAFRS